MRRAAWIAALALATTLGGCRRPHAAPSAAAPAADASSDEPVGPSGEPTPETPEEHGHTIGTGDRSPEAGTGDRKPETGTGTGTGDLGTRSGPRSPEPAKPARDTGDRKPETGTGDRKPETGTGDRKPETGTGTDPLAGAAFRAPMVIASPSPATRYAALAPGACWKELQKRKLPFARSKRAAGGVATPVQSTGPLNGVRLVIPRPPSPYGVLDCRLALTLDDTTRALAEMGVVEIQIDNTHRPKAKLPRRGGGNSQHAYGLAADVTRLKLADGTNLRVDADWGTPIGEPACGPDATIDPPTARAITLRNMMCELARRGVFHHMLTPSFDRAHRDHFHLDIKRGEKVTRIR